MFNTQTEKLHQKWLTQGASKSSALELARLYQQYKQQTKIDWHDIQPLSTKDHLDYHQFKTPTTAQKKNLLGKLAIVKLNGGLGTSMGCQFPKSLIPIQQSNNFLNLCIQQIEYLQHTHQQRPPLLLMNSFATDKPVKQALAGISADIQIQCLKQSQLPRLNAHNLNILDAKTHQDAAFYPPGHGDFFKTYFESHILDQWLAQGIEYLFVSSIDNLCATVDFKILQHMEQSQCPFLQEVTLKTPADIKGGALVKVKGRDNLKLLEIAEVPEQHLAEFYDLDKFPTFNTNNLWLNLKALQQKSASSLELDVILNPKKMGGLQVWQLETAIGSAVQCFAGSQVVQVPRDRFFPVKTTNDLFLLQSDLFKFKSGFAQLHKNHRWNKLPHVQLSANFKNLAEYQKHIINHPNIVGLEHLKVEGQVSFGSNITLKGSVQLVGRPKPLKLKNRQIKNERILS